ncbi:MAG: hypothetical protein U0694_04115 [Anaerolineae bacterium]
MPGLRFWGGAISFPYYRPAVFTVWELEQMLVGGHFDPFALHVLNVLCFGMAGVVLGRVVERITRRSLAGYIAGLTFVLFPFSYAAVILVAALFHMMLALCAALTLFFALAWLDRRRIWTLLLCWLSIMFVGVFSHENGVLVPLLALLLAVVYGWRSLFDGACCCFCCRWGGLCCCTSRCGRRCRVPPVRPGLMATVWVSLGIVLQGLVYPFVALTRALTCAAGSCAQATRCCAGDLPVAGWR